MQSNQPIKKLAKSRLLQSTIRKHQHQFNTSVRVLNFVLDLIGKQ